MDSNSLKRLLVTLSGVAVVALNKKLGLELDSQSTLEIVGLITAYVTASNWKETTLAKVEAAGNRPVAPVVNVAEAKQVISEAAQRGAQS